jgi:hypothetical protein
VGGARRSEGWSWSQGADGVRHEQRWGPGGQQQSENFNKIKKKLIIYRFLLFLYYKFNKNFFLI